MKRLIRSVEQSLQPESAVCHAFCCHYASTLRSAKCAPIPLPRLSVCSTVALRARGYTKADARAIRGAGHNTNGILVFSNDDILHQKEVIGDHTI